MLKYEFVSSNLFSIFWGGVKSIAGLFDSENVLFVLSFVCAFFTDLILKM